jgi:hypothetical protein
VGWIVSALDFYGRYVAGVLMVGAVFTLAVWLIASLLSWLKRSRLARVTRHRVPGSSRSSSSHPG